MSRMEMTQLISSYSTFSAVMSFLAGGLFTSVWAFKLISLVDKLEDRVRNLEQKQIVLEAMVDQPQDETV